MMRWFRTKEETIDETDLPNTVKTWSVDVGRWERLNYGQIHEMIHRDIVIGNDYRKERIKLLITLATGVFALTATFHKDFFGERLTVLELGLVLLGWLALIISLLAGIVHFRKWEDFYLEHRSLGNANWKYHVFIDNEEEQKKACIEYNRAKSRIDYLRKSYKIWNTIQSLTLVLGLVFIGGYVATAGYESIHHSGVSHSDYYLMKEEDLLEGW
jgi:hypothetical protein